MLLVRLLRVLFIMSEMRFISYVACFCGSFKQQSAGIRPCFSLEIFNSFFPQEWKKLVSAITFLSLVYLMVP